MTIIFNGGADPEEVKFNGQDMETVIFNGVTVWEKVVGDQYTVTSAQFGSPGDLLRGWSILGGGSISPLPTSPSSNMIAVANRLVFTGFEIVMNSNSNPFPASLRFEGVTYQLNNFSPGEGLWTSLTPAANLQPLYNSINTVGNNTTFELIYP